MLDLLIIYFVGAFVLCLFYNAFPELPKAFDKRNVLGTSIIIWPFTVTVLVVCGLYILLRRSVGLD